MDHYTKEVIIVEGKEYSPVTDVLHEAKEGIYTNVIANKEGKKYNAFYNQQHYDNNDWSNPIRIIEKI